MGYRKLCVRVLIPLWVFFCILSLRTLYLTTHTHYTPMQPKKELQNYACKTSLSSEDYALLFEQTGLGPDAVDALRKCSKNPLLLLQYYQNNFYAPIRYSSHDAIWSPQKNQVVNQDGQVTQAFSLADIQDGDILLSFASYTSGVLHGHAGIIVNAKKKLVLEASTFGSPSCLCELYHWYSYTNCIQLRLKAVSISKKSPEASKTSFGKKIADYALTYLTERSYDLNCGIFCAKEICFDKEPQAGTQCAHLVWSAYKAFGYDIDSNGGKLVTVSDLAKSPLLEVVQIYGLDTAKFPIER